MIYYKVKARYAINLGTDDFQLKEVEKVFTNENPIEARKEAYSHYKSYLEILEVDALEGPAIMFRLMNPLGKYYERTGEIPSNFPENLGIGLYYFSDDEDLLNKHQDYFIIGSIDPDSNTEKNLELEKEIYDLNNWDTQNWVTKIKYYDSAKHSLSTIYVEDPNAVIVSEVLWTPEDFWSNSNPSVWAEDDGIEEDEKLEEGDFQKEQESLLSKIISQGENRNVEFKSSLRYCYNQKKHKDYIEIEITRTIAAFANTEGGLLLIGVADNGEILGLENDFGTFRNSSKDSFLKHFDNLIRDHFTEPIDAIINFGFEQMDLNSIFKVQVEKSKKPRFLNTKIKDKEFLIRRSGGSASLDIEDASKYIIDNWYARD